MPELIDASKRHYPTYARVVLQVSGKDISFELKFDISLGAMMFLILAFLIFFYSIYQTNRKLWTGTAFTFLLGLGLTLVSVFLLQLA
jgi:hypothetical protein